MCVYVVLTVFFLFLWPMCVHMCNPQQYISRVRWVWKFVGKSWLRVIGSREAAAAVDLANRIMNGEKLLPLTHWLWQFSCTIEACRKMFSFKRRPVTTEGWGGGRRFLQQGDHPVSNQYPEMLMMKQKQDGWGCRMSNLESARYQSLWWHHKWHCCWASKKSLHHVFPFQRICVKNVAYWERTG